MTLLSAGPAAGEQLGRLLESQDVGVVVFTYPQLVCAWVNDQVCRLYSGWQGKAVTSEQLLGQPVADPGIRAAVMRAGRTGLRQHLELSLYTSAEVRQRYVRTVYFPITEAQGVVHYVVGIWVDVTDLVLSRREITRLCGALEARHEVSYRQFAKVLDGLEISMALLTYPELRYLIVNEQTCQRHALLTGQTVSPSDFLGRTLDELSDSPIGSLVREAGRTGQARTFEPSYVEGQTQYAKVICSPLKDDQGHTTHILSLAVDVTQLVNARKEIERLAAAKDEFLSVVSHEMRTPITVILAGLQLLTGLEGELDPGAARRQLRSLVTEALLLKRLIGDVLDTSRLDQGGLTIHQGRFPLGELVARVAESFARGCLTHRVVVTEVAPGEVEADRDRIEQVLVNLLSNAVKYSAAGTTVRVGVSRSAGAVRVAVSDEGRGIPAEDLPHLFERHFRSAAASRQVAGMGLGLYISNIIVREHGGQISVKSKVGEGSTFTFTLPVAG